MISRIFGKSNQENDSTANAATMLKLNKTLCMLEKEEKLLQKKASQEFEKAKEFSKLKNKKAAMQCLKRKKLFENQIEQLCNFQLRIHDQMITIEGAKVTSEKTMNALKTGAAEMKSINKTMNIDHLDKIMDEVNEQTESTRQIQEALAAPIVSGVDFDEDELEAELEDLEEELFECSSSSLGPTPPKGIKSAQQSSSNSLVDNRDDEDEELATLQKQMAL